IPFGEFPELAAKGLKQTGSDNYGGPVVTASGLLFIGATNFDRKFHAYDKLSGKLLWGAALPAAGDAAPAVYPVAGRGRVGIVRGEGAGGGKEGSPEGKKQRGFGAGRAKAETPSTRVHSLLPSGGAPVFPGGGRPPQFGSSMRQRASERSQPGAPL